MSRPISYSQKRAAWNASYGNSALQRLTTSAAIQDLALNELCSWLLVTPTATINVNSFVAPDIPNQLFWLTNDAARGSGLILNVKDDNAGIVAANRIYTPDAGDMAIYPGHTMPFAYDLSTPAGPRWRALGQAVYDTVAGTGTFTIPNLAAGVIAYAGASLNLTPLKSVPAGTPLGINPMSDAIAAGPGGGILNCRMTAPGFARVTLVGPLTSTITTALFWSAAT